MTRFLALLALLISACSPGEALPGRDVLLRCDAVDCGRWTPDAVGAVVDDFVTRWEVLLPGDPAMPEVIIVEVAPIGGLKEGFHRGGEVHVGVDEDVGGWVLPHELVHAALWAATGDGDVDHVSGDGPWLPAHDALIESAAIFAP